jgi:hypothetical protein
VSVFSISQRERDVFIHYGFDFEREIAAIEDFTDQEFSVPPISNINHQNQSYKQKLVCDPLSRGTRVSSASLAQILQSFQMKSDLEYLPTESYLDQVCQSVDYLGTQGLYKFPEKLYERREELRESLPSIFLKGVPMCRAHGDFSAGNMLIGDDGLSYLNDFDRSFLASFVFDLMYVAVIERWPRSRILGSLNAVMRHRDSVFVGAEEDLLDVCENMFVMDLCLFIEDRHRFISHPEDRKCKFSVSMIERVI